MTREKAVAILKDIGSHPEEYLVGEGTYSWDRVREVEKEYPGLIEEYLDIDDPRVHQIFPSTAPTEVEYHKSSKPGETVEVPVRLVVEMYETLLNALRDKDVTFVQADISFVMSNLLELLPPGMVPKV